MIRRRSAVAAPLQLSTTPADACSTLPGHCAHAHDRLPPLLCLELREHAHAGLRRRADPPSPRAQPDRTVRSRSDRPNHAVQIGPSEPECARTVRSRSNGQIRRYPFSHGSFIKEPLNFLGINPQSTSVQKKFQLSPVFSPGAP
jgi:hypothetical protein